VNIPEAPGARGGLSILPDIEGDDGAARAYYVRLLPLYAMETRRVQLCTLQKLRYLEIAHQCRAISRLRTGAEHGGPVSYCDRFLGLKYYCGILQSQPCCFHPLGVQT